MHIGYARLRGVAQASHAQADLWRWSSAGVCASLAGPGIARFSDTPLIPVLIAVSAVAMALGLNLTVALAAWPTRDEPFR